MKVRVSPKGSDRFTEPRILTQRDFLAARTGPFGKPRRWHAWQ